MTDQAFRPEISLRVARDYVYYEGNGMTLKVPMSLTSDDVSCWCEEVLSLNRFSQRMRNEAPDWADGEPDDEET